MKEERLKWKENKLKKSEDWKCGHTDVYIKENSDGKFHVMSNIGALHMFGFDTQDEAKEWFKTGGIR